MAYPTLAYDPRALALDDAPTRAQTSLQTFGVVLLLLAVTFLQRVAVPLGTFQIPLSVPIAYLALVVFFMSGRVRVNTIGFLLYAAAIFLMIVTMYAEKAWFSPFSFFYLAGLYVIYLFSIDVDRPQYLRCLEIYQKFMIVMALIAILQFVEQVTTHTMFSLFDWLPDQFWLRGYNTRPTLGYGSEFHKANGEFFLEPSFLSQYLAVAIIIEILFFGRWKRMALYGMAMFCSFSGTGMILLAVFAVVSVIKARRYELLYPVPLLLIALFFLQDNPYVEAITGRVGEFGAQGSSASVRFETPNTALLDFITHDFTAFLIGKGPGIVDQLGIIRHYGQANYPALHKLLIEYGLIGTAPFMAFIVWSFFARPRSRVLAGAFFIMYMLLSGSLLQPHTIYLFYVLGILMPIQWEEIEAKRLAELERRQAEGQLA
jgi:hypothetical protein